MPGRIVGARSAATTPAISTQTKPTSEASARRAAHGVP